MKRRISAGTSVGRLLPVITVLVCAAMPLRGQHGVVNGEWRYYGGDLGHTRYSPLDQINKDNVKNLRIVWRWKADNFGPRPDFNLEATPLMVGGTLYTTAGWRRNVAAIDGATGETLWMFRYDEGVRGQIAPNRTPSGRGVAYWTDGRGDERILYITAGYHLVALNAKTGQLIPTFGKDGMVDLYEGLDQPVPKDGQIASASPPTIIRDVAVVGAALGGGGGLGKVPVAGFPRGFDVRTGQRLWIFHTIPQPGEFGNDTWENDSWSVTGNAGVWGPMSADEELGYVYLPVEMPTGDFYGGARPGNGLFGESLVCLDALTGKRVWHYQLVHHGLWDYDIPAAPILVDITVAGKQIKAVAQVTKQAFTYVFDRATGQPVWPIVERPVPQSDVPGEKSSPTQPIPTKPPPFDRQGVTEDDLIDFTPELKAEALKIAAGYKLGPIYTPPIVAGANGLKGLLILPNVIGGANWQGGAVDPETGILYVGSMTATQVIALSKDPKRAGSGYAGSTTSGKSGTVGDHRIVGDALGPHSLPMVKPPWGRITAIDLNKGEHVWMVPNGDTPDFIKHHPALKGVTIPKTGTPERAAILVTKTLVFAGEGGGMFAIAAAVNGGGPMFHAYDKSTGEVIWKFKLPAHQTGHPMTYLLNGKQYIVLGVGARNVPAELVAFSLP